MTALNMHILPLHRRGGQDTELPGLFIAEAPRRAARSRKSDLLIMHLSLSGTATINAEGQAQLLENLAETYFNASGSATSAIRLGTDALNQFLLDRNLDSAGSGLQAVGMLNLFALREDQLYIAQSGPTHILIAHQAGMDHFYDPELSGKGLGVARTATVRFNHTELHPGDLVISTPDAPRPWQSPSLAQAYGRGLRTIHQVLTRPLNKDFIAVLLQAHEGRGKFKLFTPQTARDELPVPRTPAMPRASAAETTDTPDRPASQPPPAGRQAAPRQPVPTSSISVPPTPTAAQPPLPLPEEEGPPRREFGPMIMAVLRAFYNALKQVGYTIRSMLSRLLPGADLFTIPSGTMAFIAVAVPVVLVAIASVVYIQRGQLKTFNELLDNAEAAALYAQGQEDPEEIRTAWNAVLFYVAQAETFQVTADTEALRAQAFEHLDPLEKIERLNFQNALSAEGDTLGEAVNIVQILTTRDELYLLDSNSGGVIRAWLSGVGYVIDREFRCGPLPNDSLIVSELIDIATLPPSNSLGADLMGMDGNGNIIYCKNDGSPPIAQALAPPNSLWGAPNAFALDNGALYVLDPQTNAVWVYSGSDYSFVTPPRLFFDDQVPTLSDAVDFAIDLDDLYILHEDGSLTTCIFGFAGQPTKCKEQANFVDTREGYGEAPIMADTLFTRVLFTPPPDPSLYFMDPEQRSIYHFSLRLTFQRQFRSQEPLAAPATAFSLSPGRTLFIAYGNEVFSALLP